MTGRPLQSALELLTYRGAASFSRCFCCFFCSRFASLSAVVQVLAGRKAASTRDMDDAQRSVGVAEKGDRVDVEISEYVCSV